MKIGIIVYSKTGNTLSVAEKLKDKLIDSGHTVKLERVNAVNEENPSINNIELKSKPDISEYEVIIFAAPVNAFSLSAVMNVYLSQISTLESKKIGCFVTQFFPFKWLGGNRAIRQMVNLCKSKAGHVLDTAIVNWSSKKREKMIDETINKFTQL